MSIDHEILVRQVPAELSGDGRTLLCRIVPYNVPVEVADPPTFERYREMFVPGAFDRQTNAANRIHVLLKYRHDHGQGPALGNVVGRGVKLEERDDGLYGEFRFLEHSDGEKARELVAAGDLPDVSMEFETRKNRLVGGVMQRVKAILNAVSLTPDGFYPGAEVLALREAQEFSPRALPTFDPVLAEKLARYTNVPDLLLPSS